MQENNIIPKETLCIDSNKDIKINKLNPNFDLEKSGIGSITPIEIQEHINEFTNEVKNESKNIFPVEVFPLPIQQIIKATNESLNFPTDFFGASILYAVSLAVGNTHRIEFKNLFQETVLIYLALVGRPNTNKSHPLSFALQPIINKDKISFREFEKKIQEYEQAENKGKKPSWQKFIVQDFTPEALNEVHKFNKRGIGVYVDELAAWYKNLNRYHKGADGEFWLSNWNSKSIYIDRKQGNIFIPLPLISVVGTIQTGILNELAKDNRAQNGHIDRILFAFPEGLKKPYWNEKEISPQISSNWEKILENLLSLKLNEDENFNPVPTILKFSSEARKIFMDWNNSNTDLCNNTDNETLAGIYGKFDIHALRFSLILEMISYACGESNKTEISIEAVNGALKLVKYFQATATKVYSIISNFNPLDKLPTDKRTLYKALPDTFTTNEGLKVAELYNVPADTFHKWLRREQKNLFEKIKIGEYQKLI